MKPTFFKNPAKFRAWLEKHHLSKTELYLGYYKVKSGKASITWPESVDEALCFGWIDGVRRSINAESYQIRFTPRKVKSIWSAVNIKKVEELKAKGLMQEAGLKIYAQRSAAKSRVYSYENKAVPLSEEYADLFKKNKKAWDFFEQQPPGYKKRMTFRIMSAKREATQLSRLEKLITASLEEKRLN